MDAVWQQLQGVLWIWLGLAVGAALLSGLLRSARFKGWRGERRVRQWLRRGLDARYHSVHDITLRLPDGGTTQIDHVVLCPYGIFVLETKHLRGWIWGGEHQHTWTQSLYRHRSSFQNPIRQNWRHVKALQALLQVPLKQLHGVVVFTGECTFKTDMPPQVVQGMALIPYLQSWQTPLYDEAQITHWLQLLHRQALPRSRATRRAHVAQLQARHVHVVPTTREPVRPRQQRAPVQRSVGPDSSGPMTQPAAPSLAPARHASAVPKQAVSKTSDGAPPPEPAPMPAGMSEAVQRMWTRILAHRPVPVPVPVTGGTPAALSQGPAVCPQCAAPTVARSLQVAQGHTRYFVRCSHYPDCRFIQPLSSAGEEK